MAELWCLCHRLFHREGERPSDPDPPTGCWLVQGLYWHQESLAGCRFSGSLQADVTRPMEREREWRKDRNYFNDGMKKPSNPSARSAWKKKKTISLCALWHYGVQKQTALWPAGEHSSRLQSSVHLNPLAIKRCQKPFSNNMWLSVKAHRLKMSFINHRPDLWSRHWWSTCSALPVTSTASCWFHKH